MEEAVHATVDAVVMLRVVDHPVALKSVGVAGNRVVVDEATKADALFGGDELVGVDADDPVRLELGRCS